MKTSISKASIDLFIIVVISALSYFVFCEFDILELIVEFSKTYESYEVDEIISTVIVLAVCLIWFSYRRWGEASRSNEELQCALSEIRTLEGVIPICMHCKEIRDEKGAWNQLEKYIGEHSEVQFSHGICDKCLAKHYPEAADEPRSL